MNIYYQDEQVTVHSGDCVEVLAALPDNSVDSVCTDPPYGLEFMGKDWDRPWAVSPTNSVGYIGRGDFTLPAHRDNRNANCRACGGRQRGAKRCSCPTPQWDRDPANDMRQFQSWCQLWAAECLRVLKPGGHLLAFGGSRTWHRLACAIEDSGFEIRDSIAWLYGSGFPKSLDVSKAIDKAAGEERELVGTKDGRGARPRNDIRGGKYGSAPTETIDTSAITAPATDAAKQWQGWGTALKPAFEPIVVARKPFAGTVAANVVEHGTGALNIDACRVMTDEKIRTTRNTALGVMNDDGWQPTPAAFEGHAAGRWPPNVVLDGAAADELDKQSGYQRSGTTGAGANGFRSEYVGGAKQHTGFAQPKFEDGGGASRFFVRCDFSPSDRVFLPVELVSCPQPGDESTKAESTSAGRNLESSGDNSPTDGYGNRPTDQSQRDTKSTTETTTHSTTTSPTLCVSPPNGTTTTTSDSVKTTDGSMAPSSDAANDATNGSCSTASPFGDQAPITGTAKNAPRLTAASGPPKTAKHSTPSAAPSAPLDSTGNFPTFRYTAKAPGTERPSADGVAHPTVKPVDLMRWLIRLVTPPHGTVLDPFAGSGTTGEAAIHEHMHAILIEREPTYLPLIVARLSKPMAVGFDFGSPA